MQLIHSLNLSILSATRELSCNLNLIAFLPIGNNIPFLEINRFFETMTNDSFLLLITSLRILLGANELLQILLLQSECSFGLYSIFIKLVYEICLNAQLILRKFLHP